MSINNCQAIQKSCIDRKSNANWFTLDLAFFRAVTVFRLLNDQHSELRESSELIMYMLSYNMSTEKFQAIQKNCLFISMRVYRTLKRSWNNLDQDTTCRIRGYIHDLCLNDLLAPENRRGVVSIWSEWSERSWNFSVHRSDQFSWKRALIKRSSVTIRVLAKNYF